MLTLFDPFFWLNFLYFWLAIFVSFYIPGGVLIKRFKLSNFQTFIMGTILGMVLWAWQGYIFGYLGIRWFSYIYLLIFSLVWLKSQNINKLSKLKILPKRKDIDFILIGLVIVGVLIQLSSVWFNGVTTDKGLYFCCSSVMDNILHIAITDQIVKNFPPFEPGMFGVYIQNYHYWGSLVAGELIRVFRLPLMATDYQYMTFFISLFLGLSAILFSQLLNIGKVFTRWLVFFLYFGGDFVWILIAILRGKDFFGMNPMESGQQFLENLPRAFSVVVLFTGLALFLIWIKKKDLKTGTILSIIFSSLVGFKIYIGLLLLPGLGILMFFNLFRKRYEYIFIFILTLFLSILVYIPVNAGAGGFYFTGMWRFENLIMQGYFGLQNLELIRSVYSAHNNWLRIIEYESFYVIFFVFATFGTKLIGLIQSRKSLSLIPVQLHVLLIPGFIVSFMLGSFFSQTSGGSNTFNFLVSIFIVGSIYAALSCYFWLNKRNKLVKFFLILLIVGLTIPRGIYQTYRNLSDIHLSKGFLIKNEELDALAFLSKQKSDSSVVLIDPKIVMNTVTPYVSFLSDKNIFLSGEEDELMAHGINFADRAKIRDSIFYELDPASISASLMRYNIGYIYLLSDSKLVSTDTAYFLDSVFKNNSIKILRINKKSAEDYSEKHEEIKY